MIVANRYSKFELSPYVCGGLFLDWMNSQAVFMSDVDTYFKGTYSDSPQLIQSRTLNFLFLVGAIEYCSETKMLRLVK